MNLVLKYSGVVALVILAIAGISNMLPSEQSLGAAVDCQSVTCFTTVGVLTSLQVDGSFKLGANGTAVNAVVTGNCTIWAPAATIAASTTQQAVCQGSTTGGISALTGVTADSICNVNIASSTSVISNGLLVDGVSASSTAGTIVTQLSNLTGATFTWTAGASSSPQWTYSCFDPS